MSAQGQPDHETMVIPPQLVIRLEEQAKKIIDTLLFAMKYTRGVDLVVQSIFLTLIRVGARKDPDILKKLHDRLDVAYKQFSDMESDG